MEWDAGRLVLAHQLPADLELRGWHLLLDHEERAWLSNRVQGYSWLVEDAAEAERVARAWQSDYDQVQYLLERDRWRVRRRNMKREAMHPRWGRTGLWKTWPQLRAAMEVCYARS